jgi:serine/threonine protein kinase
MTKHVLDQGVAARAQFSAKSSGNSARGDFLASRAIAGYLLERKIGEGGMAVVYRARDERLDRPVALKVLAPWLATDPEFRQRFIRESRSAAAVDHPSIIPIYEAGNTGDSLFIAMRYVRGGDVRRLLDQGGPLPPARAWSIISQVASALDAAHACGLIHRDVKPANMLLDRRPGDRTEYAYLSDFGISKQALGASSLTLTGQFVGTLDYIAPEQIRGGTLDGRTDQYSLGCAAYELLSGLPPFSAAQGLAVASAHVSEPPPRISARRRDLPPAVSGVLAAAMAKQADDRYATCGQFAINLGRALGLAPGAPELPGGWPAEPHLRQAARPAPRRPAPTRPAPAHPPRPPRRRSRGTIVGAIGAAAAVVAAAAVAYVLLGHGSHVAQADDLGHRTAITQSSRPGSLAPAASASPALASATPEAVRAPAARPDPAASAQASTVSALLATGHGRASNLNTAVNDVARCGSIAGDITEIQSVRSQRQDEYARARSTRMSDLPDAAALRADLLRALRYSLAADADYLSYASRMDSSRCQSGSQAAAHAADARAVSYKTRFVNLWNPIATEYGLTRLTVGSI